MTGRFFRNESGYALALTLIMLPAFMGLALLIIDLGRGNNAHSDHAAAADALALAGARELDGGVDAIVRAKAAMEEITNSVSFLGIVGDDVHIDLAYSAETGGDFRVEFLTAIPVSDDLPLDPNTFIAPENHDTGGANARYVYVYSESRPLHSFFVRAMTNFIPWLENEDPDVRVGASAVATYRTAACDVTPLFICNPFEKEPEGSDLQSAFARGDLHARLIKLHPPGNSTAKPGNFGFLQVRGANDDSNASANTIRDVFAGGHNPTCYDNSIVTTKPGAAVSISQGLNVRFDIYDGPFNSRKAEFPSAANVRKGYFGNSDCNTSLTSDPAFLAVKAFPDNSIMAAPNQGVPGASIGSGAWDVENYWEKNHASPPRPALTSEEREEMSTFTNLRDASGKVVPSRYDVYRYEIEQNLIADKSVAVGGRTESGFPQCSNPDPVDLPTDPLDDPRVMFAAIVDCLAHGGNGVTDFPVNSFASIFMVNPMQQQGTGDGTIDVEIIDITGNGGNGTLDAFVRDEAVLVR
ncbi:pilus assembly protein TadG-related protein [Phaeovulum sp. NW3]|uniref:TadE/TadG family type IV pilus assembly protein n=1 Tax=Phaeovulum sp. NW3 TaxID=2934933 RepID=UPI002021E405|nr:pilus assembly protein TadG-related protein [Phaeovulum sp. NW3]MCL7464648.1 pilus assembly protein TadG-related protein [Phaeovulum sp. NW3]